MGKLILAAFVVALAFVGCAAEAATFAELDKSGNVLRVVVVTDDNAKTEEQGIAFLWGLYGVQTEWKQTSTDGSIRKNYAGPGFTYRADLDAFVSPKPAEDPAAPLDAATARWVPSKASQDAIAAGNLPE